MKSLSQNSIAVLPEEQQFLRDSIEIIGNIIKSRRYCATHGLERFHISEEIKQPVKAQYSAYKSKWTIKGIAIFLVKYQNNLRIMATGKAQQLQQLNEIIYNASNKI